MNEAGYIILNDFLFIPSIHKFLCKKLTKCFIKSVGSSKFKTLLVVRM